MSLSFYDLRFEGCTSIVGFVLHLSSLDTIRFVAAVLVTASGVLSLGFFLTRFRRRDYALLYFGLGAGFYGARLFLETSGRAGGTADLLITLFLPTILVLFIAETVAQDRKKAAWWVVVAYLAAACWGIGVRLAQGSPRQAFTANNIVVLLSIPVFVLVVFFPRRRATSDLQVSRAGFTIFMAFALYTNLSSLGIIAGSLNLEFVGFVILLGCLGYVALARTQRNEEQLLVLNKELEIARHIQSQLLPQPALVPGLVTSSRYVPASSIAGDFYDFLVAGDGLGVLIADVSGHGIPAALSASMVKVAVRSQIEHAGDPAAVLRGMNAILCGNLQGQFVSAGYLFLNPGAGSLHYGGAGHPPMLILRSRTRQVESLEQNGLLLGIAAGAEYTTKTAVLEPGDRCLLYTDGLLEAACPSGEEFGTERVCDFLAKNAALAPHSFCDALIRTVDDWCGPSSSRQPADDVTIVVIDAVDLGLSSAVEGRQTTN